MIFDDILNVNLPELLGDQPYVVVANVPYYITSAIIRLLLELPHAPRRLVLTMQLEVAERLIAKPGDMTLLSVSAQFYAKPKIVTRFNKAVFYPRPDVDSAVARLERCTTARPSMCRMPMCFSASSKPGSGRSASS